jgi:hypothetical protein
MALEQLKTKALSDEQPAISVDQRNCDMCRPGSIFVLWIRYVFAILIGTCDIPVRRARGGKMANQKRKNNPYSDTAARVEKIMAGIEEQMPNLSANDLAVVKRAMKSLARNTRAGAERLAILHLLGSNESLPGTVLYRMCGPRLDKRVRELRSVGVDIRRWFETNAEGFSYAVYGWAGFRLWQEHRLLNESEDKLPSLKRVM